MIKIDKEEGGKYDPFAQVFALLGIRGRAASSQWGCGQNGMIRR